MSKIKKPYRVTQYEQLSEAGLALFPLSRGRNVPIAVVSKDYRWKWAARIVAFANQGTSAGLGLRILTTRIEDLREQVKTGTVEA